MHHPRIVRRVRVLTSPVNRRRGIRPRLLRSPVSRYCGACHRRITGMSVDRAYGY